jgi:hypothetical protein
MPFSPLTYSLKEFNLIRELGSYSFGHSLTNIPSRRRGIVPFGLGVVASCCFG